MFLGQLNEIERAGKNLKNKILDIILTCVCDPLLCKHTRIHTRDEGQAACLSAIHPALRLVVHHTAQSISLSPARLPLCVRQQQLSLDVRKAPLLCLHHETPDKDRSDDVQALQSPTTQSTLSHAHARNHCGGREDFAWRGLIL